MRAKIRVVGIAGPAGCGKDVMANRIQEILPGYCKARFAQGIKRMLQIGLGMTNAQLDGALKEVIDPRYECSPRHMMQTLGTEWGRELIHPDIWVMAMEVHRLSAINWPLVIPDVRFANEAAWVREHGILIHVVGREYVIDGTHVSEQRITADAVDVTVCNSSSFEDYLSAIDEMIAQVMV